MQMNLDVVLEHDGHDDAVDGHGLAENDAGTVAMRALRGARWS